MSDLTLILTSDCRWVSSPTIPSMSQIWASFSKARRSILWCWWWFQIRQAWPHTRMSPQYHASYHSLLSPFIFKPAWEHDPLSPESLTVWAIIPFHALRVHVWLHQSYIKNQIWGGTHPMYSSYWLSTHYCYQA